MTRPLDGVEVSNGPISIAVDPFLWVLRAAPAALDEEARSWRGLQKAAGSADDQISGAAGRVIGGGWSGETAKAYDKHRRKVTGGLDDLARGAGRVADLLEEVADMLRANQELLTREAEKLSGVPSKQGTSLAFYPADAAQSQLVRDAISAAQQIRSRVDGKLAEKRTQLEAAQTTLAGIAEAWKPRTVGMLNMNIGMGHKNSPKNSGGTDQGDIPALAQTIADKNVDVVTMQEVAGKEAKNLERELEARTGDEWTVHFGETKKAPYWGDGWLPNSLYEPFGNAVAVRHGDAIESSQYVANHDLTAEGDKIKTPDGEVTDGDARKAVEIEITFGGR
ncbi:hypothetical protein [Nonomuraea sp. NPDC048916]|uniref:WXG100 family type VII secretion target n=1 Tax=Nonomuraea sp. NPDC048916 TaxID=3154232 RepID=UPI0033C4FA86